MQLAPHAIADIISGIGTGCRRGFYDMSSSENTIQVLVVSLDQILYLQRFFLHGRNRTKTMFFVYRNETFFFDRIDHQEEVST